MPEQKINVLSREAAYQLTNVTKTPPQFGAITPRWLTHILEFKSLEAGLYLVNRVVEGDTPLDALCSQDSKKRLFRKDMWSIKLNQENTNSVL
jgi:hypothetical protein